MSQPEVITLVVDELNDDGTTADVSVEYTRFDDVSNPNRAIYAGEGNSFTSRDQLALYRTFPKRNGNYFGSAKSAIEFAVDQVVDGIDGVNSIVSPYIAEFKQSIPVGLTPAQTLALRQRAVAAIDHAFMTALSDQGIV